MTTIAFVLGALSVLVLILLVVAVRVALDWKSAVDATVWKVPYLDTRCTELEDRYWRLDNRFGEHLKSSPSHKESK